MIELRGERFVVSENEGGAIGLLNELGHRKCFAGTGDAEKHLMLFARLDAAVELIDGGRLIAAGLVVAMQLEFHREGLLPVRRAWQKLRLYSRRQAAGLSVERARRDADGSALRRRLRYLRKKQDFQLALGVHVVAHAVGAIGFGDDDIHLLCGIFGGTHYKAG